MFGSIFESIFGSKFGSKFGSMAPVAPGDTSTRSWTVLLPLVATTLPDRLCASTVPLHDAPAAVSTVPAIRTTEVSTVIHPPIDVDPAERFGVAVAMHRAFVLVGNDGRRDGPPAAGMVTIHERVDGEYREQGRIRSPRSRIGDEFGAEIAVFDDLLVVGAPGMDGERGGAWLFRFVDRRWTPVGAVVPTERLDGDRFGEAVAITDRLVVVGGPRADVEGVLDRGRVACFDVGDKAVGRPTELDPGKSMTGLRFGTAVAIGKSIVVGAPGLDVILPHQDDVIVDRAGGAIGFTTVRPHRRTRTLLRPDPSPLDRAGRSVAMLRDDRIAVAAPRATFVAPRSGVITVHDRRRREYAAPIGPESGLGTRIAGSPGMLAASIPGRRDATGRVDAAVRINRILDHDLIPALDLTGLGVGGSIQRIRFDRHGLRLAIGVTPPGDGWSAAGVVHVVDFEAHGRGDPFGPHRP